MGETCMSGRRNNQIFCCRTNGGKFNHRFEWNFKLKLASGQGVFGVKCGSTHTHTIGGCWIHCKKQNGNTSPFKSYRPYFNNFSVNERKVANFFQ